MLPLERSTARLNLRRVRMDDLEAFVALEASLRARKDPRRQPPDTSESARYLADFCRVWDSGELGYWTIEFQGGIAGFGGVQPKVWRGRHCWNLYYRIAPVYWRRGFATEMAGAAIETATAVRPDWPVLVETRPENTAAVKVAERVGLRKQQARAGDEYAVLLLDPPGKTAHPDS